MERPFFAVPHLSNVFFAVPALFHPFFTIFAKNGKKGRQKMEERERKESVLSSFFPVPVFSLSFPGTSLVGGIHLVFVLNAFLTRRFTTLHPFFRLEISKTAERQSLELGIKDPA